MWKWLFGKERSEPRDQDRTDGPRESPGYFMPTTIGQSFEELKSKGYQGPFAWGCDGIMVLLYHGPNVSLHHDWIEAPDNHFQMQVLDCQTYCRDSLMFPIDKGGESIDHQFRKARTAPDSCCPRLPIANALKIPCLLSYPHGEEKIPEGAQCIAQAMEDLWNIFLFDGYLYFTRSWTGQLRYRARLLLRESAMFVTEVEASRTRPDRDLYANLKDEELPVKQVDFLIKAILYRMQAPAPLPGEMAKE